LITNLLIRSQYSGVVRKKQINDIKVGAKVFGGVLHN